jgi:hypothetical protein
MPLTDLLSAVEQPYPGLRSFEMSESLLFLAASNIHRSFFGGWLAAAF